MGYEADRPTETTKFAELTSEEISILDHTLYRASAGRYCGNSPAMQHLVELGLMVSLGKASWCPDEFFQITTSGREALKAAKSAG